MEIDGATGLAPASNRRTSVGCGDRLSNCRCGYVLNVDIEALKYVGRITQAHTVHTVYKLPRATKERADRYCHEGSVDA